MSDYQILRFCLGILVSSIRRGDLVSRKILVSLVRRVDSVREGDLVKEKIEKVKDI